MGDLVQMHSAREPWVPAGEVADYLSVSVKTVRRMVAAGLPARRVGGQLRFRISAVDAWFDRNQGAA